MVHGVTATDPVQRQPAGDMPCHGCAHHIIPLWECRFCFSFRDRIKSIEGWKRRGRDLRARKAAKAAIEVKQEVVH
jgi:hypothetical protein